MLSFFFFWGGGGQSLHPQVFSDRHISMCFLNPKNMQKGESLRKKSQQREFTGIYGYVFDCDIHHWFYDDSTLIFLCWISYFVFFSNACGAGGASAGGVVGAWSYPQKISGPTHETGSFFGGRLLFGGVPAESWCLGLGTFWYIRHFDISSISCSETDGVTHFLFQKATFWDGESADCIRQYLRKGLRSSIKKEASSCFVRTTGCWRDAYCSSEAWLDMLDVWTLHVLSQQDCIYKVTIGYLSCL